MLRSYSEERRPIFQETAEDFIAARIGKDGEFLDRYNPERDRAEFEQAWKAKAADVGSRVQVYEPHYEGSSVVAGPTGRRLQRARRAFVQGPRRAPSHAASSCRPGDSVFEELGTGFTLLAFDADDADVRAFEQAAGGLGVPLTVVRDTYKDGREAFEARLILVRPDQYVVWTGDRGPADAAALLAKVAGRD